MSNMLPSECQALLAYKRCCVLLPTYNNAGTLLRVINEVLDYCVDVLVVNDGSTDETAAVLEGLGDRIRSLSYAPNAGKGVALKKGFELALELGFEYAITIDSDGQHYPKDLPVFARELELHPSSLVIGARRRMTRENNVPKKSNFGNALSTFWYRYETGIRLTDTQSGYRLYPIAALKKVRTRTRRYDFELEILIKAAWADVPVRSVDIDVYYPPPEERISHFRPFADFMRITWLNIRFATLATLYYIPRRWWRSLKKKT